MNWMDRARRELQQPTRLRTANTAETPLTAVMAVSDPAASAEAAEALRADWEERAAIMEFDGGLPREDAERAAWEQVYAHHRLN